jgi:hypothetical protein
MAASLASSDPPSAPSAFLRILCGEEGHQGTSTRSRIRVTTVSVVTFSASAS